MRYLPLTEGDRRDMLAAVGAASVDELFRDVPEAALLDAPLDLPAHAGEIEVERALGAMAGRNLPAGSGPFFLGAGAYRHHVPAAVDHLIQRSEFLTAYTPYQPEISQGTLQALFEFQTQVALLTGMDVANASLYDGATACAEAVAMACRVTRRPKAVLSGALHPHYREVSRTASQFTDHQLTLAPPDPTATEDLGSLIDDDTACVVVQNPGFFGHLRDYSALAQTCHDKGALLVVVVTEAVSLGAVKAPGAMGADIFAGEGQSLGNGLNFGGPYLGLFAVREKLVRQMPGRLCGEALDAAGQRAFVLTLATREQHIRREKATSNICTNSGLCALAFCIHLSLLGETGFARLARLNHAAAVRLADALAAVPGIEVLNRSFFNEFTVRLPGPAAEAVDAMAAKGVLGGVPVSRFYPDDDALKSLLLVAATETACEGDFEALAAALEGVLS